ARLPAPERGPDGPPPSRPLVEEAHVEITMQRERERARNRRSAHEKHVRLPSCLAPSLGAEQRALLHTEAVLLVYRHEAELPEARVALHERVRPDGDQRFAARQRLGCSAPLSRREAACHEHGPYTERLEQRLEGS